jgi:hypothetical protein
MRFIKKLPLNIKSSSLIKNVLLRPVLLFLILPFLTLGAGPLNLAGHSALDAVKQHTSTGWNVASGYNNMYLNDVNCSDTSDCTAVGSFGSQGVGGPSVVSITSGVIGQVSYFQSSNGFIGNFTSVSCTSIGNCLAVGYVYADSGKTRAAYAQETNGTWGDVQTVTTPAGDSNDELFNSVSCSSPGNCTATGDDEYSSTGSSIIPMYDTLTNGNWGSAAEITTGTGYGYIYDVSCADATDCVAVGTDDNSTNVANAPIEVTLANGTWTSTELSATDPANTIIKSVSCNDAQDCTAVGQSNDSNGYTNVIVATESQGTWTGATSLGQLGVGRMNSVSCVSFGNCTAVGWDDVNKNPLYSIESAGTWGSFASVSTGATAFFYGVGCAQNQTTESCIAVGENEDGSLVGVPFGQTSQSLSAVKSRANSGTPAVKGALLMSTSISRLPGAPNNIAVSAPKSGSLAVSWQAPTLTGSSKVKSYTVTASNGAIDIHGLPTVRTCTTANLSCTLNGLVSSSAYNVSVSATNTVGQGAKAQAQYQIYPVTAVKAHLTVIPGTVKAGKTFTLLTYGDKVGRKATFTVQGSSFTCTVNTAHQCFVTPTAGSTPGKYKAKVVVGTTVLRVTFTVRS